MSFLLAAIVVVGILLVLAFMFGGRGVGLLAAVLLVGGGAAAFFLVGFRAAPPPVAVAVATGPAATAVATPATVEGEGAWVLRGRVLEGAEGEVPAAGAVVHVELPGLSARGSPGSFSIPPTDEQGRFTLQWKGGEPRVVLHARAAGRTSLPYVVAAGSAAEITLRLLPAAAISGRVLDHETGNPVAGAMVSWSAVPPVASAEDGSFTLDAVPLGSVTVTAFAKGYARGRAAVALAATGRTGLEIRLRPGTTVAGTVFAPDGAPKAGAKVTVGVLIEVPVVGATPVPQDGIEALSDADGKYLLEGLPVGRKVRVEAEFEDLLAEPADAGPLAKGVPQEGVDLRLAPAGTILATVVDGSGAPVPGARVSVVPADEDLGGGRMGMLNIRVARGEGDLTDEKGATLVRPVKPGNVKVRAAKSDFRDAEAPAVAVRGAVTALTLTLDAGRAITGKVVDGEGLPVAGATVSARRFGGAGDFTLQSRTAGEDGSFRIGGLDGRGFTVRAEKSGYVATSLNAIEAGRADLVVTLVRGGAIVGTVAGPDGTPLRKFRVVATLAGSKPVNPMDWERFVAQMSGTPFEDAEGRFRMEGLEPGAYSVEARADDLAPGRTADVAVAAAGESKVALVLGEGLEVRGIVVRKADGAPVPFAKVRIPADGLFGDFDMGMDEGDLGAVGELAGEEAGRGVEMMTGMGKGRTTAGADGRFSLKGLEPGTVKVAVSARGQAPATVRGVQVPASSELRIELPDEASVEGVVTDASGAPKAGASIMLQRIPTFMRFARTDAEGKYRIGGLGAGSYLFYVMDGQGFGAGNLNMKSESVVLAEGKATRKDHRMGEGTRVAGTVRRGGKPVGGVMVMLTPAARSGGPAGMLTGGAGGGFAMGSTKPDGTYEITGVASGRYTVSVQTGMGGAPSGGDALEVGKGAAEVRHDVALPEAGIKGTVVDEDGKPVPGAAVTAVETGKSIGRMSDLGSAMEAMGGQSFTDDAGAFQMDGMKEGSFRLQVQASGYGTEVVENVATGSAAVTVTLRRGIEVTVLVVGPDGNGVRGAALFLADAEGRELTNLRNFDAVRTGEDGRVVLKAPAGNLQFEAVAAGYAPGETIATVPGGEVTIRLSRGAGLKVTVVGAGGAPIPSAGVELLDAAGKPFSQRFSLEGIADLLGSSGTAADGTWTKRDLPAGTWRVRAALPDGRSAEEKVVLVEGETAAATITLR